MPVRDSHFGLRCGSRGGERILAVRSRVVGSSAVAAAEPARCAPGGRSADHQRHPACAAIRLPLEGLPGGLRAFLLSPGNIADITVAPDLLAVAPVDKTFIGRQRL